MTAVLQHFQRHIERTCAVILDLLEQSSELRDTLDGHARHFRARMTDLGFELAGADHAIIPVMLGDARLAAQMSEAMLAQGIYVIGFSFPVVPRGKARIRTQMSAALSREDVDRAIDAFANAGRELGVIG